MLVKIVTLFLVVVAVLAMFGGLRQALRRAAGGGRRVQPPRDQGRCPDCGRPRIGRGPCPCRQGR